jgi:hypothetical protein
MIKQYSKGGTDAIITKDGITFSRWIFAISSVVKSFQSIAKTVSFSPKKAEFALMIF